jgi:hypothetical protein
MVVVEDLRERDHWCNPGRGESLILKWMFKKWDEACTGLI